MKIKLNDNWVFSSLQKQFYRKPQSFYVGITCSRGNEKKIVKVLRDRVGK